MNVCIKDNACIIIRLSDVIVSHQLPCPGSPDPELLSEAELEQEERHPHHDQHHEEGDDEGSCQGNEGG